jgi:2-amino-4-hydroxy-6-hydroxymethyldihydropteridine diphosphokinase
MNRRDAAANSGESTRRHITLISVGSNLNRLDGTEPIGTAREAISAIEKLSEVTVCGLSRWYRTSPMPPSGQPDYINAVVALYLGASEPACLLEDLLQIETSLGRERSVPNAARTIDLDIIAIGDLVRTEPDPILPHPRAHLRAFVLRPLLDVAPDWVHPVLGRSARALLDDLPDQGVRVLEGQAGV